MTGRQIDHLPPPELREEPPMTDLMTAPPTEEHAPPEPPAHVPPTQFGPPPPPAPSGKEHQGRRSGWRFAGGVATGVVLSALAVGTTVIINMGRARYAWVTLLPL